MDGISGNQGLVGSAIGAVTTAVQNKKNRDWNAEQAELNRQFQSAEAETARQFSANEAALQREWSSQEAERARDWNEEMYEKYNSLSGKIQQAEQSGVNPMFAVSGNSVTPMSASSSAPSGASASAGGSPSGSQASASFVDLIGSMLGMANLKAEIDNINADTKGKETQSEYTSWLSKLSEREYNIITEYDFDIQSLESEIGLNNDQANLAFQTAGKVFEEAGKIAEDKRFLVETSDDREKIVEYERLIKEFDSSISSTLEVLDGDKKVELSDLVGAILKAIFAIKN